MGGAWEECDDGANVWIEHHLHDCVYTYSDAIGFSLGLFAIVIWVGAQLPQFLNNIRNQSAEALSVYFLAQWFLGDTLNLFGCLLNGQQLWTTTATACYFVLADVVMLIQFVYYTALQSRRRAVHRRRLRSGHLPPPHRQHHLRPHQPHSLSDTDGSAAVLPHAREGRKGVQAADGYAGTQHQVWANSSRASLPAAPLPPNPSPPPPFQSLSIDTPCCSDSSSSSDTQHTHARSWLPGRTWRLVLLGALAVAAVVAVGLAGWEGRLPMGGSLEGHVLAQGQGGAPHAVMGSGSVQRRLMPDGGGSNSRMMPHLDVGSRVMPDLEEGSRMVPDLGESSSELVSSGASVVSSEQGSGGSISQLLQHAAGWLVPAAESSDDGGGHWLSDARATQEVVGTILGYCSTVMYLAARISQIMKNRERRSAEGLSIAMFCLCVCANLCTGTSILLRAEDLSQLRAQLPWLTGTLGTVSLDILIGLQAASYNRVAHAKKAGGDQAPLLLGSESA